MTSYASGIQGNHCDGHSWASPWHHQAARGLLACTSSSCAGMRALFTGCCSRLAHLAWSHCDCAVIQELAVASLYDKLHVEGLRPEYGKFMAIAEDTSEAMAWLHSQRPPVVHRDLSTRNVLVASDGSSTRIADFGLAITKRGGQVSVKTVHHALGTAGIAPCTAADLPVNCLPPPSLQVVGTAAYTSPEAMEVG